LIPRDVLMEPLIDSLEEPDERLVDELDVVCRCLKSEFTTQCAIKVFGNLGHNLTCLVYGMTRLCAAQKISKRTLAAFDITRDAKDLPHTLILAKLPVSCGEFYAFWTVAI
jgi:hypothetical protein